MRDPRYRVPATLFLFLAALFWEAGNVRAQPADFTKPNYANSPPLRKFVDSLPGLGAANANNLGQYIPIAVPDRQSYSGSDYYEIGLSDHSERMHSDLPATGTKLRGYYQINGPDQTKHYLGPLIIAERDRPVRIKFFNQLPTGAAGDLFLPVDTTIMGAGEGPVTGENYTQNRATLHLHGGFTPWISDGTAHQWITPAGEVTSYHQGVSVSNVPDMGPLPQPGDGTQTFFYPNQQSSRLMFYHDHAYGLTRLNVYGGEAAGYLLTDPVEQGLVRNGTIPADQIPLIIQDKTFVPDAATLAAKDPLWDVVNWGGAGSLWFPHVYQPNQNPDGTMNPLGRWDYGPWVWPPAPALGPLPHPSIVPEAFMDTPLVNGTAYPYVTVRPKAYRFRILNACNDRFLNLQLYYADPTGTELTMVPANGGTFTSPYGPVVVPRDGRAGGVPDPAAAGPAMIQIGSEGGMLPAPVVLNSPPAPVDYDYDRRSITFGNIRNFAVPPEYPQVGYTLLLGPAERADVIIDFSQVPAGSKLILYNDAPAPVPAFDPRYDYYTGDPDNTAVGGAPSTLPGYGPNTRTILQFRVAGTPAAAFDLTRLQTALPAAFTASQPAPLVPLGVYGSNASFALNGIPVHYKTIAEDFDLTYGRMNAMLGTEQSSLNSQGQATFGMPFTDPPTEVAADGETQVWSVIHNGVDTHAIHWHLVNVQVLNRVDWAGVVKPPDPNELGWKETVRLNPLENLLIAVQPKRPQVPFAVPHSVRPLDVTMPVSATNPEFDLENEYVWHCHLLGHEENDMMRPLIVTGVPKVPPSASPTGLTAIADGGPPLPPIPQVILEWTYDQTGATSLASAFRIERAPVANGVLGGFAQIALLAADQTVIDPVTFGVTYTDPGLPPNTTYSYRVTAFSLGGNSAHSNVATVTTLAQNVATAPGAPIITGASAGNGQANVGLSPPAYDGGSPVTGYTVISNPAGGVDTNAGSTALIHAVTGLTNGTSYTFTATATNAVGTSAPSTPSNAVTPAGPPSPPTNVSATAGNGRANVTFTASGANGSPITGYTVVSSPSGGVDTNAGTPATTHAVTGLTNGTAYTFTVTATNAVGTSAPSAPSAAVTPLGPPAAPSNPVAVTGNGQASVSFTASASNGGSAITGYTVVSSPAGGVDTQAGTTGTTHLVTGLTNGTAYTFTVRATNAVGTSPASGASGSVTPKGPPGAPTTVAASGGNGQASVTFAAPAANGGSPITGYTVVSSPAAGVDLNAGSTATTHVLTGLTNGTSYTFTVTATNALGTSIASAPSNAVVPLGLPGVPTNVVAAAGDGQASISFSAPASNGGSPITGYTVTSSPAGGVDTNAGNTATTHVVTGLTNGTSYTFTVTGTTAVGSAVSAPSGAVVPKGPPSAPTNVVASPGNAMAIVTFTAPASDGGSAITGYTVTATPPGAVDTNAGTAATTHTLSGLTNGTSYTFTVTATNAIGRSPASAASTAVTPSRIPTGVPLAPSNLTVGGATRNSLTLTWVDTSANNTRFTIQRATTAAGPWKTVGNSVGTATTFTNKGLKRNTTYYYQIRASNLTGTSAWVGPVSGTTLP